MIRLQLKTANGTLYDTSWPNDDYRAAMDYYLGRIVTAWNDNTRKIDYNLVTEVFEIPTTPAEAYR